MPPLSHVAFVSFRLVFGNAHAHQGADDAAHDAAGTDAGESGDDGTGREQRS